jgi:hypothetical protein
VIVCSDLAADRVQASLPFMGSVETLSTLGRRTASYGFVISSHSDCPKPEYTLTATTRSLRFPNLPPRSMTMRATFSIA